MTTASTTTGREGQDTIALSPVPGVQLDPPQKDLHATAVKLDERHLAAGLLFRVGHRFLYARIPLLSAGTAYYVFLALISLVAFAYGLFALFGADWLAQWLTAALDSAFPGLLGPSGVSPEAIRDYGTISSVLGLVVLAVSGTGSVHAAGQSLHTIFGAARDPRNIVLARIRMVGQMLVLGPLILASFVPSLLFSRLASGIRAQLEFLAAIESDLLIIISTAVALALNFVVAMLLFSWLGGIRPPRRPRLIGAAAGAVALELVKSFTAAIIAWSLSKPQYGAFAVPITIMLLIYLMSSVTYTAASLTAVLAIRQAERTSGRA